MSRLLEIIAVSVADVIALSGSCCDRIELCVAIERDGLSPSVMMIEECLAVTSKPIRVMVRFDDGFSSSDNEKLVEFIREVKGLRNSGFLDGFVLGFLEDDTVDLSLCSLLINECFPFKVTFHKACDVVITNGDLDVLKLLDVDCFLTQGGVSRIDENYEVLSSLKDDFKLLLGGGVTLSNFDMVNSLGCDIHIGSLARLKQSYDCGYDFRLISELKSKMGEI